MDAGGLAHMTYNNYTPNSALGVPGSGFASRGKGGHIKRLSVAPPQQINSIYEDEADANPVPRTSRSHLLAGLRTAPKASAVPASAPYTQSQHYFGLDASNFANRNNVRLGQDVPQTAMGSQFAGHGYNHYNPNGQQHMYCLPEQVLSPSIADIQGEQMDPQIYDELMATKSYLDQRQQQLQQQLINVTAAAQQFQGMNLNGHQQYPATPVTPYMSIYNQQLQNGVQPIIQPVVNQPGIYSVYNPMTGQHSYFVDQGMQYNQQPMSPPSTNPGYISSPDRETLNFQSRDTMAPQSASAAGWTRTTPPPKLSSSPPSDVTPLPPPSANAFRPGHKKSLSMAMSGAGKPNTNEGPKKNAPRSAGFPPTPMTGTFGPGMGRAGEHPVRQPRGPPPMEELVASPTSKHEGSKNFATRQRRRALHSLVRAGNERRNGRNGSVDAGTPGSESEMNFPTSSDADSESNRSGNLTGHSSVGSLRAAATATGAIGSERKEIQERSRDRTSLSRRPTGSSLSSDDGSNNNSKLADALPSPERRMTPTLVLTPAEERKGYMV